VITKNGFSLIELIIVMGISALLIGGGITAINSLRDSIDIQNSLSQIEQNIQLVENMSRNSVTNMDSANWFLGVYEDQIYIYSCRLHNLQAVCTPNKKTNFTSTLKVRFASGCDLIGYSASNLQMIGVNGLPSGSVLSAGRCELQLYKSTSNPDTLKSIIINIDENKIIH